VPPFRPFVILLASWLKRQVRTVLDYLIEEDWVHEDQLEEERLRFTDEERLSQVGKAKVAGSQFPRFPELGRGRCARVVRRSRRVRPFWEGYA
jgi:hypothetical protein